MLNYPTPHFEKLKATLISDKLPSNDKPQVEKAISSYHQWIIDMDATIAAATLPRQKLQQMVVLLNQYRIRMDIDLIFDSPDDWLYRQKGQIKLDNSVIEEFLPRLIHPSLIPEISQAHVSVGPTEAFSSLWFDSSLIRPEIAGGLKLRVKDQDFAISRPLYLKASHTPDYQNSTEQVTHLAYIALSARLISTRPCFKKLLQLHETSKLLSHPRNTFYFVNGLI